MSNTRFSTALHVLTLLAKNQEDWVSSDYIAGSICINPVMVRRELSSLNEAGLIYSRKGKDGGSKLSKKPEEISLGEVYLAVKNSEILGKKNKDTNSNCPVGSRINQKLEELSHEADSLLRQYLDKKSLAEFAKGFD
ncbi:transcriptional regulator, BadM/Rrf2 family [Leadbetterella byssophila DSM 17132]|uniref:Transcriptional regulator, BadM/Rrf2 family n=1 Tax=Leadbetterella byssophila (strain DSM 17132 / JCM 16389 / KACC 11308 / NBRC 106382 / 4M15) TaxID=649349 RepID=E4RVU4_LEAB4|nr:Rrf2 family transcriptional regulator [Leadbetterella byssophila]ADQ18854.1 transcriptional regulator, BadM/Rrf2 family [Leadbetterella byssophila DSM 17132]